MPKRFDTRARTLIGETTRRRTLGVLLGGAIAALGIGGSWESEEAAARKKQKKECQKRKHGKQVQQGKKGKKRKPCEKRDTPLAPDPSPALSPVCPAPSNATYVFQRQVGSEGTGNGEFDLPYGVAVAPDGTLIVDNGNERIQRFSATGGFLNAWESAFDFPTGIAVSPLDGTVYVCDSGNDRMQRFEADGTGSACGAASATATASSTVSKTSLFPPTATSTLSIPAIAVSSASAPAVSSRTRGASPATTTGSSIPLRVSPSPLMGRSMSPTAGNHRIQRFTGAGVFMAKWGSEGASNGQFDSPSRVDVAADGTVHVIDKDNLRIQRFSATGAFPERVGERKRRPVRRHPGPRRRCQLRRLRHRPHESSGASVPAARLSNATRRFFVSHSHVKRTHAWQDWAGAKRRCLRRAQRAGGGFPALSCRLSRG